jgi:hypothetical protein
LDKISQQNSLLPFETILNSPQNTLQWKIGWTKVQEVFTTKASPSHLQKLLNDNFSRPRYNSETTPYQIIYLFILSQITHEQPIRKIEKYIKIISDKNLHQSLLDSQAKII